MYYIIITIEFIIELFISINKATLYVLEAILNKTKRINRHREM